MLGGRGHLAPCSFSVIRSCALLAPRAPSFPGSTTRVLGTLEVCFCLPPPTHVCGPGVEETSSLALVRPSSSLGLILGCRKGLSRHTVVFLGISNTNYRAEWGDGGSTTGEEWLLPLSLVSSSVCFTSLNRLAISQFCWVCFPKVYSDTNHNCLCKCI